MFVSIIFLCHLGIQRLNKISIKVWSLVLHIYELGSTSCLIQLGATVVFSKKNGKLAKKIYIQRSGKIALFSIMFLDYIHFQESEYLFPPIA